MSDLLTAVHLENLTSVFVLNGYDTTEDIKHISVDDLDYLGIEDTRAKDIILDTVQDLNINQQSYENLPIVPRRCLWSQMGSWHSLIP